MWGPFKNSQKFEKLLLEFLEWGDEKINKLLSLGKEAKDISLMPSVLTKYDLQGLNNTINVLQISGLDPEKVPLMAY